jgi:hypothetical protein
MTDTTGNYDELDPEIEKAFPYVLTDNDRNRIVFGSGYRAARQSDYFESLRSRIAALEAVVREVERTVMVDGERSAYERIWAIEELLDSAPSTVLDQMIREAKAEALRDAANVLHSGDRVWAHKAAEFLDSFAASNYRDGDV